MKSAGNMRRLLLFAALAATVALAAFPAPDEAETVVAPARSGKSPVQEQVAAAPVKPETGTVDAERLRQRTVSREFGDLFPGQVWQPPPPPPQKPPTPKAPPLPFTYFGRMVEGDGTVVFLSRQDQTIAARVGDTIASSYRVEEIGAASVVLNYLPLNERQVLNIGAIN